MSAILKRKLYVAPLLAGLGGKLMTGTMIGSSILGVKQGADANSQSEEAAEAAAREQKRHNKAMEEAAKQNAASAINAEEGQKVFAATQSVMKNIVGLGKDLYKTQKGNIATAGKMAVGFGAIGYAGNRLAESVRDHKENNDEGNKNFLKKAAIATGTIGGSILAARKGLLGPSAQKFMTTGKGGSVLRGVGKALNPIARDERTNKISVKGTLAKSGMNAAFIGMPTVSYLAQRRSSNDMMNNTLPEQEELRQYSWFKSGATMAKNTFQHVKNNPSRAITGGVNKVGSIFGFYGKGGTAAVQRTGESLKRGESEWGRKLGDWITKKDQNGNLVNAGKANLLATGGTLAVGTGIMSGGNALINKPMRVIDRDAYKMEDEQNGKV